MINLGKELHEKFLAELKTRIPERGKLASYLIDILYIEKEAVYRRLRGEVPFTFAEIAIVAKKLNISLDSILEVVPTYRGQSYRLYGQDFFSLTEVDFIQSRDYIASIKAASKNEYSEFGFASSVIPMHFSVRHQPIFRLYMLKWMYQFGNPSSVIPYAKINILEKLREFHLQYLKEIQAIKYTYFVWDELLMFYITNDIKYFHSIQLISDEEVLLLKEELAKFLTDLERLTRVGTYESGNEVEIYVSNLNFETTYSYLISNDFALAMISTFSLSATTSVEPEACENMRMWLQSLKRTSIKISTSAEMDRAKFFRKQRDYLDRI
ncbi:MAG: hypothetical protein LBG19_00765 [Prevotellaceae bacterium]|jgi:hypothetical protein|nr:hypothetical protein [Prevotellaceae bacterium]